ncbi:MAG: hypothetical protein OXG30_02420 [bacterium]|nr:hypothetical protein [bacterium]
MADAGGWEIPRIVLDEWRERCVKQEEETRSWRALSKGIPVGVISGGAIVIAAADDLASVFAGGVLIVALTVTAVAVLVECIALRRKTGPDLEELEIDYMGGAGKARELEKQLAEEFKGQYKGNKWVVNTIRVVVAVQGGIVFVCALVFLFELT